MITVKVVRDQSRKVTGLFVNGHSGYAQAGSDIICAGASTLCLTAANALEDICGYSTDDVFRCVGEGTKDLNVRILVPETGTAETKDRAQVIMRTCELGLMSIARDYNDKDNRYIEIIKSKTPEV